MGLHGLRSSLWSGWGSRSLSGRSSVWSARPARRQDSACCPGHLKRPRLACRCGSLALVVDMARAALAHVGCHAAERVWGRPLSRGCPAVSGFHPVGSALHTCLLNVRGAGPPVGAARSLSLWGLQFFIPGFGFFSRFCVCVRGSRLLLSRLGPCRPRVWEVTGCRVRPRSVSAAG